jgi:hypothetical protein
LLRTGGLVFDRRWLRPTASGLGLGIVLITLTAMPASASETADEPIWRERADRLCERVPRVQLRGDRILDRLQAGANVKGSIAWLTERADRARDERQDDLATFFEHRATIRTERIDVLNARADALDDAASWCAERDDGAPGK